MISALQWIFGVAIIAALVLSVFYSIRSRRQNDARLRGLYAARLNICMGLMLMSIALFQFSFFSGSSIRVVVGALFLLLGLFNLFAGIRNHSFFTRQG